MVQLVQQVLQVLFLVQLVLQAQLVLMV